MKALQKMTMIGDIVVKKWECKERKNKTTKK